MVIIRSFIEITELQKAAHTYGIAVVFTSWLVSDIRDKRVKEGGIYILADVSSLVFNLILQTSVPDRVSLHNVIIPHTLLSVLSIGKGIYR